MPAIGRSDTEIAELEEEHIRRGVQQPQAAVGLERIQIGSTAEANRQHDLVDIAGRDVLLATRDAFEKRLARHARLGRRESAALRRRIDAAAQRSDDLPAKREPLVLRAAMQQGRAPGQVVEHEQRLRRDISGHWQVRQGRMVRRQAFEVAHDVVAGGADETARERYAVERRVELRARFERALHQGVPFCLGPRRRKWGAAEEHAVGVELELGSFAEPEKRVAREALAALDALE